MSAPSLPPLPERAADAHKGDCGRLLVVAGSSGMTGAGALVCRAALRSGAGLVTWAISEDLVPLAETLSVESISWGVPGAGAGHIALGARELLVEGSREMQAVALGPGMGVAGETGELMRLLVPEIHAPLVLDAGALGALAGNLDPLQKRSGATVVTPHPGEMARLVKKRASDIQADREATAKRFAALTGSVTVLKGAGTVVTDGERVRVNESGNPGMATGGSGDVLTGCILGLLGQGMDPFDAAVLGVHLHGTAGDIAAAEKGVHGLVAGDIVEALPAAFLRYAGDA